ncbi:MAG TPA: cytochrome c3 family protein [Vicinamibacterales bacterium]|nr:cytochrome c3 family protein [Vicinamibacterales bacterium]
MPLPLVFGLVLTLLSPPAAPAPSAEDCLACHGEPGITMTFADGSSRSLEADGAAVAQSVHAGKAGCVDCHPEAREVPHPERTFASARQFAVSASEACRRCHFSDYRRTLDSVHAAAVARGDLTSPVCVDCHGSHDMRRPNAPRTRIADTCAKCHEGIAKTYAASVHGRDVARNIADVPTCTDCHRSHDIGGPHQNGWKTSTPDICGRCHSDPERMRKYNLSTDVLKTYAADFHGKTASLRKGKAGADKQAFVALCTDCHGVHDIVRVTDSTSKVIQANLTNTCRKCHPNASHNFPQAWLSHYEPSWKHSPAVYAVKIGYSVFIPFIIGGLILQMLLHLWRMAVNR